MSNIFKQTMLYKFLIYCEKNSLEKIVLDCGAGGPQPPLALFKSQGYETYGIDIDGEMLNKANSFAEDNDIELNMSKGDMRSLPYEDRKFSFVYSYNTIFHMTKKDVVKAVEEMNRVLKPGGLLYANFLSVDDFLYGEGEKIGEGEFLQEESHGEVVHTFYEDDEPEVLFKDMDILFKQKRDVERRIEDMIIEQSYLDYIVEKT